MHRWTQLQIKVQPLQKRSRSPRKQVSEIMGVTPGSVHKNMFPKSKKGRGRAQANNAANTSTDIPIRQVSMLVEDKGNDEVVVYAEYNPGKQPKGEYPKILCRLVDHLLRMTLENKNWR